MGLLARRVGKSEALPTAMAERRWARCTCAHPTLLRMVRSPSPCPYFPDPHTTSSGGGGLLPFSVRIHPCVGQARRVGKSEALPTAMAERRWARCTCAHPTLLRMVRSPSHCPYFPDPHTTPSGGGRLLPFSVRIHPCVGQARRVGKSEALPTAMAERRWARCTCAHPTLLRMVRSPSHCPYFPDPHTTPSGGGRLLPFSVRIHPCVGQARRVGKSEALPTAMAERRWARCTCAHPTLLRMVRSPSHCPYFPDPHTTPSGGGRLLPFSVRIHPCVGQARRVGKSEALPTAMAERRWAR